IELNQRLAAYERAGARLRTAVTAAHGHTTQGTKRKHARNFLSAGQELREAGADVFTAWGDAADELAHLAPVLGSLKDLLPAPVEAAGGRTTWPLGALIQAYDEAGGMEAAGAVAAVLPGHTPAPGPTPVASGPASVPPVQDTPEAAPPVLRFSLAEIAGPHTAALMAPGFDQQTVQ
ncbi:hypothetical protein G3I76_39970, partial [Streptomyces sp. SID11233]|nr:hypothetical protein [Streptomyces sp. SID11233]